MILTLSTSSSLDSPSHPHIQSHRWKAASFQPHPTGACLPELLQHGGGLERLFAMPLAQTREPLGHAHYEELEPFCAASGAITWSVFQAKCFAHIKVDNCKTKMHFEFLVWGV